MTKETKKFIRTQEVLDIYNSATFYIVIAPTVADGIKGDKFLTRMYERSREMIPGTHCAAVVKEFENNRTKEQFTYIIMSENCKGDIAAHEAFHLTYSMMEMVGVTLCRESEEAFAYLLQNVYKRIEKATIKYNRKYKQKVEKNEGESKGN